jgi:hypothetical protein
LAARHGMPRRLGENASARYGIRSGRELLT